MNYNHLVKVKEREISGVKHNPLFCPYKSCDVSVIGANYTCENMIIIAFIKVMLVFCVCVSFQMCLCAVVIHAFNNPWRTAGHILCAGHVTGSHKIAITCALSV